MFPKRHQIALFGDCLADRVDHALPDAAEVAQVEDVVEFRRRRQHLVLRQHPQAPGQRHQLRYQASHGVAEAAFFAVVSLPDHIEDLVDGRAGRQSAIEDVELALQSLRDVVATAAGMNHGSDELHVHQGGEVTRLLQIVESMHLHQLTYDFVGDLRKNIFGDMWLMKLAIPKMKVHLPDHPIR